MSTEKALDFLLSHYKKHKRINILMPEQWKMLKKYKNPNGHTSRDFINEINNEKAIVICDKTTNEFSLIEGENFLFFIEKQKVKPLYVYAPFLSNVGLSFNFALYKNLKEKKIVTLGSQKTVEALLDKLKLIFVQSNDKSVVYKDNMILITNYDINVIIDKLEQNNFKFESEIFTYYKSSSYQPIYPDLLDIKYHFPQDQIKNSTQSMETIFNILAKNKLTEENYTRIRKLVRKMTLEDLNVSRKTALDLNLKESQKINFLYELEIKRRKVKNFLG